MKDPAFGKDAVRALATADSFARGRDYVRSGAVSGLVRRGDRLTAHVEGSDFAPYEVTVDLHQGGVAATRCSCPYDWGGACKHVVAVLLKYLDTPDSVVERPPLDGVLRNLDREALAALLTRRAEEDPAFALWIEAELAAGAPDPLSASPRRTAVDPEPIKRQAEALLSGRTSRRDRWSDNGAAVDEDAFAALIDKAKPFLEAGDGRNALRILEPVTEALVPAWLEQADWDETLHEFFPVLGQMIAEAVLLGGLLPEERDDLMVRLDVWQGMLDEYGLDDHLQVAIDALEQGWDEIGLDDILAGKGRSWPLSGHGDWTTARLTQARLRVLEIGGRTDEFLNLARAAGRHGDHAAMLVRRGCSTDAIAYARKRFRSAEEALQLSRLLKETGQVDAALELAGWGLSLKPEGDRLFGVVGLARWLRDSAAALGRDTVAVTAAGSAFEHSLSLEDFRAAEMLAGPGWAELRPHLLACLAAPTYAHDRTEIFLGEGMIDEAVRSVDVENTLRNPANDVLLRLVEAAHASHPDWVIDVAERIAANVMDAGQSGFYELAAQWLEKAALAHDAAGRFEDWITRIDALIEKHRRKHKLRPLLEALRPRA
ncbi:SWIM zinc finger domain-containing protein [Mesorhizobium kowhaii]|uniref:SWIM zinc finger family protein n=1 Tax=Mesorhizobium kowhaii TaxID=1300272 RepID=UPI0035ECC5F9